MSGGRIAKIKSVLPSLLYLGEQLQFISRVERDTDQIAYVAITDLRLLAVTKDIFPVLELPLLDIDSFTISPYAANFSVESRGRKIKLGWINKDRDVPRFKYYLERELNMPMRQREMLAARLVNAQSGFGYQAIIEAPPRDFDPDAHLIERAEDLWVWDGSDWVTVAKPPAETPSAQPNITAGQHAKAIAPAPAAPAAPPAPVELPTAAQVVAHVPPPAPYISLSAHIAELTHLHSQGLLTEQELAAAKAKALGI